MVTRPLNRQSRGVALMVFILHIKLIISVGPGNHRGRVNPTILQTDPNRRSKPSPGGFADGPSATARFYYPQGIALSPRGEELYIVDGWNHRIRRVDLSNGLVSTIAGSEAGFADGAADAARFHYPHSVSESPDGTKLFVSDGWNQRIRVIALETGEVFTLAGEGKAGYKDGSPAEARFYYPAGLAVTRDGQRAYVADTWNSRIRRIDIATGYVDTLAGGVRGYADGMGMNAKLSFPRGVSMSPTGDAVYVADTGNNCIRLVNLQDGWTQTVAGSQTKGLQDGVGNTASFTRPTSVTAVEDNSLLYVADTGNQLLRAVNLIGRPEVFTLVMNRSVAQDDRIHNPFDLAVSRDGTTLFLTDREVQSVRQWWLPTGYVSTLAGSARDVDRVHLHNPVYTRGLAGRVQVMQTHPVMSAQMPAQVPVQAPPPQIVQVTNNLELPHKTWHHNVRGSFEEALYNAEMRQMEARREHQASGATGLAEPHHVGKDRFKGEAIGGVGEHHPTQLQDRSVRVSELEAEPPEAPHTDALMPHSHRELSREESDSLKELIIWAAFGGSAFGVLIAGLLALIVMRVNVIALFLPLFRSARRVQPVALARSALHLFSRLRLLLHHIPGTKSRTAIYLASTLGRLWRGAGIAYRTIQPGVAAVLHWVGLGVLKCWEAVVWLSRPGARACTRGFKYLLRKCVTRFPILGRIWIRVSRWFHLLVNAWRSLRILVHRVFAKKSKSKARKYRRSEETAVPPDRKLKHPPRINSLPPAVLNQLKEDRKIEKEIAAVSAQIEDDNIPEQLMDPLGGEFVMPIYERQPSAETKEA